MKYSVAKFLKALVSTFSIILTSCSSSSVLIKIDDTTFNQSQERLLNTYRILEKYNSPIAERISFQQAESFYRYRYSPPPHDTTFYLISAASAITDFPGFQSMAGSLNLLDLRLRSTDTAIQLWETFLLRYPKSNLRNLTLYRLGWAYRNAGASGFPRQFPDEPFDILIAEAPNSEFAKLALEAKSVPWKSKSTAARKSILPGLGQIYAGETSNGIKRMLIAFAAGIAIVAPIIEASRRDREQNWNHDWPLLATGLAGLIVLSFDYTSSYEDSMRGVVDWNEKKESEFNRLHPESP